VLTGHADFVRRWARTAPWRVALRDAATGEVRTYAELDARGWQWARVLEAAGVGFGSPVALLSRNRLEIFEILVACLRLGAVFTPLNWRLAVAELADIAADCTPRVLVCDGIEAERAAAVAERCPGLHLLRLDQAPAGSDRATPVEHPAESLAMLLYTSGTTGTPKGVMIPHRQIFWNNINTLYACDLGLDDRVLAFLPLFHTGGLNCLALPALYRGATVVLMGAFEADTALRTIADQRITLTVAVPTMYQMLMEAGLDRFDTRSLHTLLCGGAPCPEPLLDAYLDRGFAFRQGFGMTEVGPNCFSLPAWMAGRKRGSVGQPVLHGDAGIFDPSGRRLGPGEVGELCLRGPHVSAGYLNRSADFDAVYDGVWFHTGDLAREDEDGYFHIAGRQKDMFISGGENVYPAEIENVLLGHPLVGQAAVIGVADERWGEVGLAVVVPRGDLDPEALLEWCRARLAKFKVPRRVVLAPALPLNASGKIDKTALRKAHP
jgi:fatty-acyl-CoA synthase